MFNHNNNFLLRILILSIFNLLTTSFLIAFETQQPTNIPKNIEQIKKNLELIKNNLTNETDSVLYLCKSTLHLSKIQNYEKGVNQSYFYIGYIYFYRNVNDSAIHYFKKGIDNININDSKNLELLADLYWELANVCRRTGKYSSALEKSLFLKELVENNKIEKYSYQIYNLLGLSYQSLMEYELAFENYEKSAMLAEKNNNKAFAGVIYANIGDLFYEQNNLYEALKYFEKGLKLEEQYKLYVNAGFSYITIANIYLTINKLDSVTHYLKKSYRHFVENNSKEGLAEYFLTYGKYYLFNKEYENAANSLEKSIEIAEKIDLKLTLSESYKRLAEINFLNKDYEKAYNNHKKFFEEYNSIYNVAKINKAKALEQKLKQQEKESQLVTLELEKQKTVSLLLIIIVTLSVSLGITALIYVIHFKKLNKELKKSKEKAEESDKLKSQFLRTISHEIRTPLNGITGFSEMISNEKLDKKELNEINNIIAKNSNDLISTIENMVDMAHLTTNEYTINKSTFELSYVLKSCIKKVKEDAIYANKKDIKIIITNKDKIEVFTDKGILKKIIKELVKNALLYTEKGSITLGYNQENSQIKLFVKDAGIGISQKNMDIIFSPFRRSDEVLNQEGTGTGLGLSLVNEFVKILNGKVWFGSEPNKGSIFFISIPIK